MNKILLALIILSIFSTCKIPKQMTYQYSDGSNNTFIITSNSRKYLPVSAEQSSSGLYDGGQEKTVKISAEEYKNIRDIIEKTVRNNNILAENRVMMSSLIKISTNNDSKIYILKPDCPEQIKIESILKQNLNSE